MRTRSSARSRAAPRAGEVPRGHRGDTGSQAGRRSERLGVDMGSIEPERGQAGGDLLHERRRAAQVCLGIARRLQLGEQCPGKTARMIEITTLAVARAR